MLFVFLFLALSSGAWARPGNIIGPQNVVTVPPNCPVGQELINGVCRDVWARNDFLPSNVVTVPANCPSGQQLINGQCRDVWSIILKNLLAYTEELDTANAVAVPPNCGPNQQLVNGQCRDVWRSGELDLSNVISVPPNCPPGQQWINGRCRDVWRNGQNSLQVTKLLEAFFYRLQTFGQENRQGAIDINNDVLTDLDTKNVISVPNQCPAGTRPDALGEAGCIFIRVVTFTSCKPLTSNWIGARYKCTDIGF